MKDRIKEIRKDSYEKTLEKFGEKIGISGAALSQIENGKTTPTTQTIKAICNIYNVSEEWLRTGKGEKYVEEDIEFSKICSKIGIKDEKAKKAITEYWHLSDEDKELFWKFMERFIK